MAGTEERRRSLRNRDKVVLYNENEAAKAQMTQEAEDADFETPKSKKSRKSTGQESTSQPPSQPRSNKSNRSAGRRVSTGSRMSVGSTKHGAPKVPSKGLIGELGASGVDVEELVKQWIVQFKALDVNGEEDAEMRSTALQRLLNLVLHAAGFSSEDGDDAPLTVEQIMDADIEVDKVIDNIVEECPVKGGSLLFNFGDKALKTLHNNFEQFWTALVEIGEAEGLLDEPEFHENVMTYLAVGSTSRLRPLRLASTCASQKYLEGLVKAAATATKEIENDTDMLEKEKKGKKKDKDNKERISMLEGRIEANEKTVSDSDRLADEMFKAITVHRYRDVDEKVREMVIRSLTDCVSLYPTKFGKPSYTKYVGWTLFDTDAAVRCAAVESLIRMCNDLEDATGVLGDFIDRFTERIVSMVIDVNPSVCALTLELLIVMNEKLGREVLTDDQVQTTCQLLREKNPKISAAAAKFVETVVMGDLRRSSNSGGSSKSKSKKNKDREIAMQTMEIKEHVTILKTILEPGDKINDVVDTLWGYSAVLREVSLMGSILLRRAEVHTDGNGNEEDDLDDEETAILARMMCVCLKRLSGKSISGDAYEPSNSSAKQTKKDIDKYEAECGELGGLLEDLLTAYKPEESILIHIAELPLYMNLSEFGGRSRDSFKKSLDILSKSFLSTQDDGVSQSIGSTLLHLAMNEHAMREESARKVMGLSDQLRKTFSNEMVKAKSRPDVLHRTMHKLNIIISESEHDADLVYGDLWDELMGLLEKCIDADFTETVSVPMMNLLTTIFVNSTRGIIMSAEEEDGINFDAALVGHNKEARDNLLRGLEEMMRLGSDVVKTVAFEQVCEICQWTGEMVTETCEQLRLKHIEANNSEDEAEKPKRGKGKGKKAKQGLDEESLEQLADLKLEPSESLIDCMLATFDEAMDTYAVLPGYYDDCAEGAEDVASSVRKQRLLCEFSKAFIRNYHMFDLCAPRVLRHYINSDVKDTVKQVYHSIKGIVDQPWKIEFTSLTQLYESIVDARANKEKKLAENLKNDLMQLSKAMSKFYFQYQSKDARGQSPISKLIARSLSYALSKGENYLLFLEYAMTPYVKRVSQRDAYELRKTLRNEWSEKIDELSGNAALDAFFEELEARANGGAPRHADVGEVEEEPVSRRLSMNDEAARTGDEPEEEEEERSQEPDEDEFREELEDSNDGEGNYEQPSQVDPAVLNNSKRPRRR